MSSCREDEKALFLLFRNFLQLGQIPASSGSRRLRGCAACLKTNTTGRALCQGISKVYIVLLLGENCPAWFLGDFGDFVGTLKPPVGERVCVIAAVAKASYSPSGVFFALSVSSQVLNHGGFFQRVMFAFLPLCLSIRSVSALISWFIALVKLPLHSLPPLNAHPGSACYFLLSESKSRGPFERLHQPDCGLTRDERRDSDLLGRSPGPRHVPLSGGSTSER
ncbi:hypothetical protein MHYP_G00242300 [Metynnis hypsauchen]